VLRRPASPAAGTPAVIGADSTGGGFRVVYVNTDTLLEKYQYYKELKSTMESEGKRAEANMSQRDRDFQQKVAAFQQKVQESQQRAMMMTESEVNQLRGELEQTDQKLAGEEQELMKLRNQLAENLAKREADLNKELRTKIDAYLEQFCTENGYDLMLTKGTGGAVLRGLPGMDVTAAVVQGLNDSYAQEKAAP
jgi:outer membrane protein